MPVEQEINTVCTPSGQDSWSSSSSYSHEHRWKQFSNSRRPSVLSDRGGQDAHRAWSYLHLGDVPTEGVRKGS